MAELTPQRTAELFMMVHACMDAHESIEDPERQACQWEYEELMFKTLATALRETEGYSDYWYKNFRVMWTAPRCDRPFVMDWLESIGVELDPIFNKPDTEGDGG